MTATVIDEAVDLSDLDTLDDTARHARCTWCQPGTLPPAMPFTALCGVRAIYLSEWDDRTSVPPDACDTCVALWFKPCARCGK